MLGLIYLTLHVNIWHIKTRISNLEKNEFYHYAIITLFTVL